MFLRVIKVELEVIKTEQKTIEERFKVGVKYKHCINCGWIYNEKWDKAIIIVGKDISNPLLNGYNISSGFCTSYLCMEVFHKIIDEVRKRKEERNKRYGK